MTQSVNWRQASKSAYEIMWQMPRPQGPVYNRYPDMFLDEERLKPNNTAHRTLLANL
jgi:hypothetical protein